MNFQDLIRRRYSVRAYDPRPVEEEKLARVLEAACLAPSACNRQPFRIVVVPTRGREEELGRVYGRPWFVQAPLVLAVCALPAESWRRRHDGWCSAEVDATIALDHLILAAADEGLGTCWIAAFDPKAASEVLNLPSELVPVAFTPLGYPADSPGPKKRRPPAELIRRGRF
ncbi:MAG: nitroreductase [Acidobacteria bacterium]|jgi:nitroreductase|nr:nitroreductase family protein [Acidobacteriota bacterium]OQB57671.1 MAG: FMN reductase (NAD(P)H) [Candidatus Aminicenantes bacterium ADurb.Bin147]HNQ80156.1 nitroreductase family protein [Candidatus Aminicenantes bacterium]NMD10140.1 nitroreductase [Acidobacteriota bacterium]HNT33295.1 nitroreductase family protein [Candidatus Aminicenantes bacterium]